MYDDSFNYYLVDIKKECDEYEYNLKDINDKQAEEIFYTPKYYENPNEFKLSNDKLREVKTRATYFEDKLDNNLSNYINDGKNYINEVKTSLNKSLGKKRGRAIEIGDYDHNKFSDDNLRRLCKHLVLKYIQDFINNKIKEKYNNNIGKGIFVLKLLTLNQKQKSNSSVQFNKEFLNKTLGDILSDNISTKYTNYSQNHNKQVINHLKNEKNEEIRDYFNKLFNLTFLDCLKYFRGSDNNISELQGLTKFDVVKNKYKEDKDYFKTLNYYMMNFELIINNKKARKRKKRTI